MKESQDVSYQLKSLIANAANSLFKSLNLSSEHVSLEHPTAEDHGDYSTNIALQLAKQEKRKPIEVAEAIVTPLKQNVSISGSKGITKTRGFIEKIEVADPGFINFWLKNDFLIAEAVRAVKLKDHYGSGEWGKGKRWLIEHTSPNPNKAMHLGHLRNNVTGMAIANLWDFSGIEVIRDCIDNNRGIAMAKLMWGYLRFARRDEKEVTDIGYWFNHRDEWLGPEENGDRPDRFVDDLYTKGAGDFEASKETEEKVRQLVVDWEAGEEKNRALWAKVLDYSHRGQLLTLERLGNEWDQVWHEDQHYQMGKDIVDEALKQGIFKKTSEGAIITDLESYSLPNTVVIKSDGTSLYITQDLALTKLKREKFTPEKLFWVIGPEQSLALKQMFAVCEQLGIGKFSDYTHIAYGYMSIKGQGKMSSRKGNVIYIDELIDDVEAEVKKISKEGKGGHADEHLSEKVALGAVKYSILKVGRLQDIAFSLQESVNFEGDSGPYLQYAYARAKSVLRKAGENKMVKENSIGDKLEPEEVALLHYIYRFPEVIEQAAKQIAPNTLANYLFELAKKFNAFYNQVPILTSKDKSSKLILVEATAIVIGNGLRLLGIDPLEQM